MSTLQYRALFYDPSVDPKLGCDRPCIYVFWHEYILIPLYLRGNCNLAMLLSRHRDADILTRVAFHMGFDCVRGSTNRGAAAALLEMARLGQRMHLTITPDGPRGPRRKMAVGAVYLASRLGLPIVPLGLGADRPWRVKSWDRHAIPRPFSQVRGIMGPPITIAPDLDRDQLELSRQRVEQFLTDLTIEAEDWAASGARRPGEVSIRPESRSAQFSGGLALASEVIPIHARPPYTLVVPKDRLIA
ncbi:MAG: lysophospholipid acyltransferase family protein [Planctomycetales bacterium]|nr:lysophospholipid acyltransferase family protein [Planctomycetales bacterium]